MKTQFVVMMLLTTVCGSLGAAAKWTQERFEKTLWSLYGSGIDNGADGDFPEYVPLRNRDSLADFKVYLGQGGWTTNDVVRGLIYAVTNNIVPARWGVERNRMIASVAMQELAECREPAANAFLMGFCTNSIHDVAVVGVRGIFMRTNLEPEVLEYMRTVCVRTNLYERIAAGISSDLIETLQTMPDLGKTSATNRLASYLYFTLWHLTRDTCCQDEELAEFLPAYSNSVQRLSVMRHVAATATNGFQRTTARQEVARLSSLTNLVDLSWLERP